VTAQLRLALACVAVALASAALADDASDAVDQTGAHVDVRLGTQYDSNVFFVARDEVASASAVTELTSGYRWQGELTGLDLSLDGRYQPYEDQSLSAATAIEVAATLDREHEYGNTRARIAFRDESALINALDNQGKFVGDERQDTASGSLRRRFEISETSSFVTTLEGSRVTYVNTPPGVRQDDYDFATGAGEWQWQSGERTTFGAGVVGSWYSSDGNQFTNEVRTAGPALSMSYELGETTSGYVDVSYRRSDSKAVYFGFIQQHDAGSDYYGRAGVTKRFERGYLSLDAGRTVQPGSSGRQEIRDEVTASFSREITERVTLHGGATALKSAPNAQGSVAAANDRRTAFAGDVGVDYELAANVTLSGAYRYLRQNTDAPDTDARAQTVMMTLRWTLGGTSS
jgi:opacity protein-like surface antigen